MGKRIKDKDPDCKVQIPNTHYRCGGCGSPFPKEVVKYASVSGYDDGVDVGICVECQQLFDDLKETNVSKSLSEETKPVSNATSVQATV